MNKIPLRIKKSKNNQYIKTNNYDYWIRNYTNSNNFIDINDKTPQSDFFVFLKNEFFNNKKKYTWIDSENIFYEKSIIVSDGFDFDKVTDILNEISVKDNICIFGVNNTLSKWKANRSLTYYVVNNPYDNCLSFLPRHNKPLPKCIASNRTNYLFLENYNGLKYRYMPTAEEKLCFTKPSENLYQIDDCRNPVCAAVALSFRFRVKKILFLCCDDVFEENKPGSIEIGNELFCYQVQDMATEIIDSYCYWLKNKIELKHYCRWKKTNNIEYIDISKVLDFIKDEY